MGGQFNQAAALLVQPLLWQESRTEPNCLGQLCWITEINCGGCFFCCCCFCAFVQNPDSRGPVSPQINVHGPIMQLKATVQCSSSPL